MYLRHLQTMLHMQVSRHLMDSSFRRCNQLDENNFELEMSKKTIHLDLPMHIGCFVYQYAKLRMLQFYYDFVDVLSSPVVLLS
jgi:hypothetical protein